ncbi:acetyltransferase [Plectosphaerella cucumerina]|uniref:Acetyltransferase n=1 Tax=Plectosphaerella cucumerina TaxID=40658 RepID=A0A8K0TV23_9PEZI|nr:acetyltransferase [Plectosphaerella cucumerina]
MAFIRPYQPSDFEAAAHICRATLPGSLSPSRAAYLLAPYIWTHPYTTISPATCHVLEDGTGRAVGYCIGCPDVLALEASYQRYVTEVLVPAEGVNPPRQSATAEPWTVDDGKGGQTVNEQALLQLAYDVRRAVLDGKEVLWGTHRATMHIDLLEEWQGKGWGKQLIGKFVESVKEKGGYEQGIHIGIAGDNGKVVPFYEKCGFKLVPGGEASGGIWMARDVSK